MGDDSQAHEQPGRTVDKKVLDRLHRRIKARRTPHAVVKVGPRRYDLIPVGSARLDALFRSPAWVARVVGVFTPEVTVSQLSEDVRS